MKGDLNLMMLVIITVIVLVVLVLFVLFANPFSTEAGNETFRGLCGIYGWC